MRAPTSFSLLLLALIIGAAIRVEFARLAPPFLVANDSADYFTAGYTLLQTGELQISLKRTPLYSIFLAGAMSLVGPSLDRLLAIQHALGLVSIALAYLLGRLTFGSQAGAIAALAMAVNGSMLTMEHLLITEALYTPLLLATLVAYVAALKIRKTPLWLLAGLLLGLGTLCRPLGFGVLLAALAVLPVTGLPRSLLLRASGLLVIGAMLCVAPWIVRQAAVYDRPMVNGGLGDAMFSRVRRYDPTFVLRDDGRSVPEADRAIRARIFELAPQYEYPREIRAILRHEFGVSDGEADRLLRDVALTVIAQDPARYAVGTLAMTGRLLRGSDPGLLDLWISIERDRVRQGWPDSLTWVLATERSLDDPEAFRRARNLLAFYRDDLWSGVAVIALAPLGAAWASMRGRRSGAMLIPLVILSQVVLYVALDGPLFRYRFPYQPLIIVLAAGGLALVLQQLRALWHDASTSDGSVRDADGLAERPSTTLAAVPGGTASAATPSYATNAGQPHR